MRKTLESLLKTQMGKRVKSGFASGPWMTAGRCQSTGESMGLADTWHRVGTWQESFQSWREHQRDYGVPSNSSMGRNGELNKRTNGSLLCQAFENSIMPIVSQKIWPVATCLSGTKELFWRFPSFLLGSWPTKWTWVPSRHSLSGNYCGNSGEQASPEMQVLLNRCTNLLDPMLDLISTDA